MRLSCLLALCSLLWIGCAGDKSGGGSSGAVSGPARAQSAAGGGDLEVTPGGSARGSVALVNPGARYAVISFPIGGVPAADKRFNVYRGGVKVGEIKITGPQRDNNTVGDIVAGEAQKGDELRED